MMKHCIDYAFVVFLAGCNSAPPNIRASDYDQTCTQASDCMAIDEGSGCCGCGNAAINKKDQTRYQEAARQRRSACAGSGMLCAADCAYAEPVCTSGRCAICRSNCSPDAGAKDAAGD